MNIQEMLNNPYIVSARQKQALRSSVYGRGGVLRTEVINGEAKIISNVTGMVYDSIDAALTAAGVESITEIRRISTAVTQAGDRFGAVSGMLAGLKAEMLRNPAQLAQTLQNIGVDLQGQSFSEININLFRAKKVGGGKSLNDIAQSLIDKRSTGDIFGIPVTDDEGIRLVQFVLNPDERGEGITLTESQSHRLLAAYKRSFADYDTITGIFNGSDPSKSGVKLMETLGKLVKRVRGDFSEREISLSAESLQDFLGVRSDRFTYSSAEDAFLLLDRQYELMLKQFIGGNQNSFKQALERIYQNDLRKNAVDIAKFYEGNNPDNLVGALMRKYGTQDAQTDLENWMRTNIERVGRQSNALFRSDSLASEVESSTALSPEAKALFKKIFEGIDYSIDGTALMNVEHFSGYVSHITAQIDSLKSEIARGSSNDPDMAIKRAKLRELENDRAQITRGGSLFDQVTGRGHIYDSTIKTSYRITEFIDSLNKYVGILSKSDLKKGYGFAGGVETLQLSGFGRYRETVFTDPVTTAFHGSIVASDQAISAMRQNADEVMKEFETAVRSGVISEKIRKSIAINATQDIENLPDYMRESAARNRQYARSLQEMLQSGISPQNSPDMINMLYKHYMSQIYRRTDKGIEVVTPDVFRFALSTEEALMPNERRLLGEGMERLSFAGESLNLAKFRIKGHSLMFAGAAIKEVRPALGGFDLDDKGMPRIVTIGEGAEEKLGFLMTRQPSGMQEYLIARSEFDPETLKAIFGEDTRFGRNFIKELESYSRLLEEESMNNLAAGSIPRAASPGYMNLLKKNRLNKILEAVTGRNTNLQQFVGSDTDLLEQDIIEVLRRMESNNKITITSIRGDTLSSIASDSEGIPLRVTNQMAQNLGLPATTRFGTYQLEAKIQEALSASTESEMIENLRQALPNYTNLSQQARLAITGDQARGIAPDLDEFIRQASTAPTGSRYADDAVAIINDAWGRMGLKRATDSEDILGVYVNRSMLAGSTRDQIEAISRSLDEGFRDKIAKFSIGLLPQETAIDAATTLMVGGMEFGKEQIEAALQASIARMGTQNTPGVSVNAIEQYISSITDAQGNIVFGRGNVGINTIGNQIVRNLSVTIGLTQAAVLEGLIAERAGIDRTVLDRVIKRDAAEMLRGYIDGMKEYGSQRAEILESIQKAEAILASSDEENIQNAVRDLIQLSDNSVYAYNAKVANLGYEFSQRGEILSRSLRLGAATDPSLSTIGISRESEQIAKSIISNYKDEMTNLFRGVTDEGLVLSELENAMVADQKIQLSARMFSEINQAAIEKGQTLSQISDALQYEDSRFFARLSSLPTLVDDTMTEDGGAAQFIRGVQQIREAIVQRQAVRQSQYRAQTASDATRALHEAMVATMGPSERLTMENVDEAFERMGNLGEAVSAMRDIIAGRDVSIDDPNISQEQALQLKEALSQESKALRALIETSGMSEPIDNVQISDLQLSEEDMQRLFGEESRPISNRATFTKFRDFVRGESFREMFREPIVKRSLYAVGALIAGSLMYTSAKDRSPEDMAGPPLLPGGSAYEQNYPMRVPEIGTYNMGMPVSAGVGMSYNINLSGSRQDVERAREAIAAMNISQVNATIYNALPRGNNDPLANFASSY